MTFSFTAITPKAEFRQFFYYVHEMEVGFNALSLIAAGEDTLLKAEIIDNDRRIPLPVEAFDGEGFSVPIQRLQDEWEQVLDQPVNLKSIHDQEISIILRRQQKSGKIYIACLELAIGKTEQCLNHLQESTFAEPNKSIRLDRYKCIYEQYKGQLTDAQMVQEAFLTRLIQLDR